VFAGFCQIVSVSPQTPVCHGSQALSFQQKSDSNGGTCAGGGNGQGRQDVGCQMDRAPSRFPKGCRQEAQSLERRTAGAK
jgi:hypothetical protein